MDTTASHNITHDIANLSIHFEYGGTDEVILGDSSGLSVSHICSLILKSPQKISFHVTLFAFPIYVKKFNFYASFH